MEQEHALEDEHGGELYTKKRGNPVPSQMHTISESEHTVQSTKGGREQEVTISKEKYKGI